MRRASTNSSAPSALAPPRRGLLGWLLPLLLSGPLAWRHDDEAEARGRRKRRKKRHKHGKGRHHGGHKKHCQPKSHAKTCAGKCGPVKNNCKKTVDCGPCAQCDVCASGCPYTSIQAAIDDPAGPTTIRLCAETYGGTIGIDKDLTLIGAGDGEDGTILDGQGKGTVVTVDNGVTVDLEGVRITGGNSEGSGAGINNGGTLTLTGCSVTGNESADQGGGIYNGVGVTVTLNNSSVTDNDPDDCFDAALGTGCP